MSSKRWIQNRHPETENYAYVSIFCWQKLQNRKNNVIWRHVIQIFWNFAKLRNYLIYICCESFKLIAFTEKKLWRLEEFLYWSPWTHYLRSKRLPAEKLPDVQTGWKLQEMCKTKFGSSKKSHGPSARAIFSLRSKVCLGGGNFTPPHAQ